MRTIVFDVNETLLSLEPIRIWFERSLGDRDLAAIWFARLLRSSFVAALTGAYRPFTDLAAAALDFVAGEVGRTVNDDDRRALVGAMRSLPPHPDSAPGLELLREAGFRLATLTNSPPDTATTQLTNAGLAPFLDTILSVELAHSFKPHPAVYRAAAEALDTRIEDLVMVAAHDWDVAGMMAAGGSGAFVARPGQRLDPLQTPPEIVGADIIDVARRLIAGSA